MAGLTTLLYILPLTFAYNFLSHRTLDTCIQLIHPAWILLLTSSLHLPSLLTVEHRYLKFFVLLTFSPCSFNSSPSSTPPTLRYSVLLRLTFRLFSPVHFFKSPDPPLAPYDFVYTELCHPMVRLPDVLRQSSMMMAKRNGVSAEPWWSSTPTLNSLVNPAALLTVVVAPSYISWIIFM